MSNRKKGILAIVLFAFALIMLFAAGVSSGFADWYAQHIYPVYVNTVGRLYSAIPYSAAEIWLYLLIVCVIVVLVRFIYRIIKRRANVKKSILTAAVDIFLAAAVLFIIFTAACGINYKRPSFSEKSDIKAEKYTEADLKTLCILLTEDVNEWSSKVKRNSDGIAISDGDEQGLSVEAMKELGEEYQELKGYYPRPKKLLVPQILSYQSLSGIYLPFTVEANYNSDMIPYNIPFTQCHELSHLRGFMQEEEANFIAYLACMESDSPFFQYSGNMLAWLYSMNVLYKVDVGSYREVRTMLAQTAEADLDANDEFWDKYEGPVSKAADKVNDTYLKANGQSDGVKSYDRMVDLLVSYKVLSEGGE